MMEFEEGIHYRELKLNNRSVYYIKYIYIN